MIYILQNRGVSSIFNPEFLHLRLLKNTYFVTTQRLKFVYIMQCTKYIRAWVLL